MGSASALVSVIIPVYNVEEYLDEAMESVTRQTLSDIEIICINDGSTDGSPEILRRYAARDERITIVDKENGGYGIGMNIGLEMARGEYIGILEPDDYLPLNMFEDLYQIAKKNDLDFVKADFYRFTTDKKTGNVCMEYNHLDKSRENYGVVINPTEKPFVTRFIMNTWSGIYKRDFIEEHHIRHNTTPGASFQDNGFFWQTMIYAKRVMFIDKPYYRNRRDNPNSSVNSRQKVYALNIEYDHIYDIFMRPENAQLWECFKFYFTLKRFHNNAFTLTRIADEYKEEFTAWYGKEMKRAKNRGEVDTSLFTPREEKKFNLLVEKPEEYYKKYVLAQAEKKHGTSRADRLEEELQKVKSSCSYKIGRAITSLPRAVIKLARRLRRSVKK